MRSAPAPKPSYEELEAEVARMREILTAYHFAQAFYRFHAFDAIRDDSCPACGGKVVVERLDVVTIEGGHRMPPGKRLKAVPWS
jgi:hypothetical protein